MRRQDSHAAPKKQNAFRPSAEHLRLLDKLARKLGVNRFNVVRIAIIRLADSERLR